MGEPSSFDPARCRVWSLHDCLEERLTAETCAKRIGSTREHGQHRPAVGRLVLDDPDFDIEVMSGARQRIVVLKIPLLVDVRQLTDRETVFLMDAENRLRQDVSPYERGRSYIRWLRCGLLLIADHIGYGLG